MSPRRGSEIGWCRLLSRRAGAHLRCWGRGTYDLRFEISYLKREGIGGRKGAGMGRMRPEGTVDQTGGTCQTSRTGVRKRRWVGRVLSPLAGLRTGFETLVPAINRWAILGRPCGTAGGTEP
jgi:hypothetical protein